MADREPDIQDARHPGELAKGVMILKLNSIHNGDCIEFMKNIPDQSIDLIVTDPPYGLNYNDNDLAANRESVFGGDKKNQKPNPIFSDGTTESFELFEKFLNQARRILKKGACCCCCCGGGGGKNIIFAEWSILMDKIIGFKHAVVWDKGGLGMGIHYRRNYEFILIAQNGQPAHRWNGGNNTPNIWRINKIIPSSEQHPTEKPVKLFEKIIQIHSNPGDIVLDPFAGHGVCAEACINLDRNFILCELNEKYIPIIKEKIFRLKRQQNLFSIRELNL